MAEVALMKGNEVVAEAAIRCGCDGYFGYPITPQSEVMETLMLRKPWESTGMVVLQAESELAAINMVYGGASSGKRVMTSSSSPGVSLMQEGLTYMAAAELPCLIVDVMRGGPGLGTIGPSQGDYMQVVKGGGNGDYNLIVLAPSTVQEMNDFVELGFDLAFKYRTPVIMLADGIVGQMMEKVTLSDYKPRWSNTEIQTNAPWALRGKGATEPSKYVTSCFLDLNECERLNEHLQAKYRAIEENEVRFENYVCEDADIVIVAYGSVARICKKVAQLAREEGIKVGVLRPITLFPFPKLELQRFSSMGKKFITVELSTGQMVQDVRLAVGNDVSFYGRSGGVVPTPEEILAQVKKMV